MIPTIVQQRSLPSLLISNLSAIEPRLKLARHIAVPLNAEGQSIPHASLDIANTAARDFEQERFSVLAVWSKATVPLPVFCRTLLTLQHLTVLRSSERFRPVQLYHNRRTKFIISAVSDVI
jgi:hypothetical protein